MIAVTTLIFLFILETLILQIILIYQKMPTDQILKMMNKNKECVQILFTHTHGNPKNI